jgi:hypothetical protein
MDKKGYKRLENSTPIKVKKVQLSNLQQAKRNFRFIVLLKINISVTTSNISIIIGITKEM